ncbi:uncharacterized protein EV154DRAFT_483730 [Mucor mucedo]|uniref:uncharacterized protein n=1 Tax=Mucor mucedo TaxID=29922 RepID=UPI002220DB3D|nr:uncharacterized protein EV154DRAFT_483730 [Mucor mucedo]KAI7888871.1 hypothetical protein EV154DRAFT_483730 [Mucor mucedo]
MSWSITSTSLEIINVTWTYHICGLQQKHCGIYVRQCFSLSTKIYAADCCMRAFLFAIWLILYAIFYFGFLDFSRTFLHESNMSTFCEVAQNLISWIMYVVFEEYIHHSIGILRRLK